MYPASSTQQPAAICALKSPADAIHILEAVRLGLVPRVTRRLTGHERGMIRPGTVWVWEEEETNMRRWTDGRRWGASRVGGGGFLVYTETSDSHSPPPSRGGSPHTSFHPSPSYPNQSGYYPSSSRSRPDSSLIKQTYSTSMNHPVSGKVQKFHVVAYSSKHNPQGDVHNPLPLPFQLPLLANLKVAPGIWPEWEHRRNDSAPEASGRRTAPPSTPASGSQSSYPPNRSAPSSTGISPLDGPLGSPSLPFGRRHSPPASSDYRSYPSSTSPHLPSHPTLHKDPRQSYDPPVPNAPRGRDIYDFKGRAARELPSLPLPSLGHPSSDRYHPYYNHSSASRSSSSSASRPPFPAPSDRSPREASRILPDPTTTSAKEPYFDVKRETPTSLNNRSSPPHIYLHHPSSRPNDLDTFPPKRSPPDYRHHHRPSSSDGPEAHARHSSAPLLKPLVRSPSDARSPKMSIPAALLNPDSSVTSGGLTLPPLRLAVEGKEGRPWSPRVWDDGRKGRDGGGEDGVSGGEKRQLGELGRKVVL